MQLDAMLETKAALKSAFEVTHTIPSPTIVEFQRGILRVLGYDPDFAVSCLNTISTTYAEDNEIMMKMQYFMVCAQISCK